MNLSSSDQGWNHDAPPCAEAEEAAIAPADPPAESSSAERLLQELCDGDEDLRDLAGALGVTLVDLARWIAAGPNAALLEGLLRLADARAAMAVCRYRTAAAAILVNIAAQKDKDDRHSDLSRKACVDLLSVALPARSSGARPADRDAGAASAPPVATAEAILRAFDRLEQQESQSLEALSRSMHAADLARETR